MACSPPTSPSRAPQTGASTNSRNTGTRSETSRPKNFEADADYFRKRSHTLAKGAATEIEGTDYVRFRRGRLYVLGIVDSDKEQALQKRLSSALEQEDMAAVLDTTTQILDEDQADIRAHILKAVALRKSARTAEADVQREIARGLIESILSGGDGQSTKSAWTVYRVEEEYEILKVLGYVATAQSVHHDGERSFDIIDARKVEGNETLRAHFDITELFAEEARVFRGR